jgi:uncharacterized protein (UPF0548 family)
MPHLRLPASDSLRQWLEGHEGPLSYAHGGGVDDPPGAGFVRDQQRVLLGHGEEVFARACEALRRWVMFPAWARIFPPGQEQQPGRVVAMVTRLAGLWWVNPARILERIEEPDRCGLTYGTLCEHAECGEERFLVVRLPDGSVWYEMTAFSRPRHWLAWLGFPLARWWQLRFVRDSQAAMQAAVLPRP